MEECRLKRRQNIGSHEEGVPSVSQTPTLFFLFESKTAVSVLLRDMIINL